MSDQDIRQIIKPNCDTCINGALASLSSPCEDCGSEGNKTPKPKSEPSAFPFIVDLRGNSHVEQGMTLRDYFAAKALPALIRIGYASYESEAKMAYKIADAMMKAREREENQ